MILLIGIIITLLVSVFFLLLIIKLMIDRKLAEKIITKVQIQEEQTKRSKFIEQYQ